MENKLEKNKNIYTFYKNDKFKFWGIFFSIFAVFVVLFIRSQGFGRMIIYMIYFYPLMILTLAAFIANFLHRFIDKNKEKKLTIKNVFFMIIIAILFIWVLAKYLDGVSW